MKRRSVLRVAVAGILLIGLVFGCETRTPSPRDTASAKPTVAEDGFVHAEGLDNVIQLADGLYSGSSPEGESGFRSLQRLGVRTIITVDGARPDVESARKFGLRYVHVPVGYDGISRDRVLVLAKAARDLPGAVYVHCHHGKHRGPAAAAAIRLSLDEKCAVEQMEAFLRQAGTDPHYKGLISLPRSLKRPTTEEVDSAPDDFPEVTTVSDLARFMVEIDTRFDRLKLIQKADWQKPVDHPDLDPAHEALLLAEHYREAGRLRLHDWPKELPRRLAEAERQATALERLLRGSKTAEQVDRQQVEAAFAQVRSACATCHAKYRDTPR